MLCDRCGLRIEVTTKDPAVVTSLGAHHYECSKAAWRERGAKLEERKESVRERRSLAAKKRWEARRASVEA
jgi:hypothetical protein